MTAAATADVVVIGAGVVGAATAHRFASRGHRVVVLERALPNGEGSGASAANIHVQGIHTRRPGQDVPVDVRRLLPLQKAARDRWQEVTAELGADVGFVASGGFMVAETPEDVADLERKNVWEREAGLVTEVVDGTSARAALPLLGDTVLAATWCGADAFVDPQLVVPAYLAAAQRLGAVVHPHHPVQALTRRGDDWEVLAGGTTWTAPLVVNAAGPWIGEIARLVGSAITMAPLAIQMHRLAATDQSLPFLVQHVAEGLSVKQDADGRIVLGGGWPAQPWALAERPAVREASIAGNIEQVRRILPSLAALPLESVWPGALGATPDEMPVVGTLPGLDGLITAGGTYSFTFAPLWADTVHALATGGPPPVDIGGFSPSRLLAAEVGV